LAVLATGRFLPEPVSRSRAADRTTESFPTAGKPLRSRIEVNHGQYVKARRDAIERDAAREALVELGLGVTPT
jgi:hypothetical protein